MRRIAVAVPARNEAGRIDDCLSALALAARVASTCHVEVVVLANNCTDETAAVAERRRGDWGGRLHVRSVRLAPNCAHAGWARRLALDVAAGQLLEPDDVLMSTDADTLVDEAWFSATLDHIGKGYDAVAGQARLTRAETLTLSRVHRTRLASIARYRAAADRLRHVEAPTEPWPRHYYEGGASIALTLAAYDAIGGAPTPMVGEDKALFDALRRTGASIRHPKDVAVQTSPRLIGRAPGGSADTLAAWIRQGDQDPASGVVDVDPFEVGIGSTPVRFVDLPQATLALRRKAGALAALRRGAVANATGRADIRAVAGPSRE